MIQPKIIDYLVKKTGIQQKSLIEKDLLLHRILFELLLDKNFDTNYIFKGGTCLMKCHLGYYRFSEDLDFTWLNQKALHNKSEKQIRSILSSEITFLASLVERVAMKIGLDFKADKRDIKYLQFGGSNASVTCKLWYHSSQTNEKGFIKIQVNYRENLLYPVVKRKAKSIIDLALAKDFSFVFPEESEFLLKDVNLYAYDIREILVEKIRAILTRKAVKVRDFVDVFLIEQTEKLKVEKFEEQIIAKVLYALRFEKYKVNFKNKLEHKPVVELGEEIYLLLRPLGKDFPAFLTRLETFIDRLLEKLSKEIN